MTTTFPPQGEPGEAGEPGLPGEGGPPVSERLRGHGGPWTGWVGCAPVSHPGNGALSPLVPTSRDRCKKEGIEGREQMCACMYICVRVCAGVHARACEVSNEHPWPAPLSGSAICGVPGPSAGCCPRGWLLSPRQPGWSDPCSSQERSFRPAYGGFWASEVDRALPGIELLCPPVTHGCMALTAHAARCLVRGWVRPA